jgi:hypothetical protein
VRIHDCRQALLGLLWALLDPLLTHHLQHVLLLLRLRLQHLHLQMLLLLLVAGQQHVWLLLHRLWSDEELLLQQLSGLQRCHWQAAKHAGRLRCLLLAVLLLQLRRHRCHWQRTAKHGSRQRHLLAMLLLLLLLHM